MIKSGDTNAGSNLISPIADSPLVKSFFKSGLEDVVKKELEGTTGEYSVYIKSLKTGETYELDSHKAYEPASLYKLWVMATVFEKITNNELSETEVLKDDIKNLNEKFKIDEKNAELKEGDISFTVRNALNQMITISHNYAALLLLDRIKRSSVISLIETYGFDESSLEGDLRTTASDIADFYEKLYKGEIVSPDLSNEMIDVLSNQTFNDRIPKYLPENTRIAHKTGELGQVKHDAGIVFTPKGDYIIVLMSRSNSPKGAAEREALVSKAVYDYFQAR